MIEYLTIEQVIELHDEMLKRYGGLPGIRDKNLLWSAIDPESRNVRSRNVSVYL
jgi:prophage maintenance system killer protein